MSACKIEYLSNSTFRATSFNTLPEIIFDIYINDCCTVSSTLKCIMFVDDTNIFNSADSLELLGNTISQEAAIDLQFTNCLLILIKLITCFFKEGLLQILQ